MGKRWKEIPGFELKDNILMHLPVPRTILEFSLAFSSGEKSTGVHRATSPGNCLYVPATLPTYKQHHLFFSCYMRFMWHITILTYFTYVYFLSADISDKIQLLNNWITMHKVHFNEQIIVLSHITILMCLQSIHIKVFDSGRVHQMVL